jgi:serine/threonine protein kinase
LLVARLNHPNILSAFGFDGGGDPTYIVMRCVEGGTLKDLKT